jgi:membrane protease YdiL (CAAX protease family)
MNLQPDNEGNFQIPPPYPESSSQPRFPTPSQALYLYLVCLLLVGFLGSLMQRAYLEVGLLATEILCLFLPTFLYAKGSGVDIRKTFKWAPINFKVASVTVLTTGAAFVLVSQLAIFQERFLPTPPDYTEQLQEILSNFRGFSLIRGIALLAVLPGICEELLFRGFILTGLSEGLNKGSSVILTGFLFGLLHLDVYRFLPVSILGILFGFIVLKTGSILAGMLAHMTNNSIILLIQQAIPLDEIAAPMGEPSQIPALFLFAALVVLILGFRAMESAV